MANNITGLTGLTNEEVLINRKNFGKNDLNEKSHRKSLEIIIDLAKEPMLFLLVIVCSIYFITDETTNGIIMLIAILIVSGISIYQEVRSGKAIQALKKLNEPFSKVIRNSETISIRSEELVVNDLMIIEEGQNVSADAEIIISNDLTIDESVLTGESFPVEKNLTNKDIFYGTVITSGWGYAKITAVGSNTKIGKLGISIEQIKKEKTPLQLQLNRFVRMMAAAGTIAFFIVWIFNYMTSGNLIHGLMHGLTLAMAVLPEEIPVAFSTFMALGAYNLIKNNIITKQPNVVESLGSATVICVDKTGTVTENKMTVTQIYDFISDDVIQISSGNNLHDSTKELIDYSMWASEIVPFDPMEKAIHELFLASGNKINTNDFELIKEYPLSGKPPVMTHIHSDGKKIIVACKGAPEALVIFAGLNEVDKSRIGKVIEQMASDGLRVLAVAKSEFNSDNYPENQSDFKWIFLGLIGLEDPPKKNIENVIQGFYDFGIKVKMITGDYPLTARSISNQVGIKNPELVLTGQEFSEKSEEDILTEVENVNVFARVLPEIKLKIVEALKLNGEVVAMTGDGVNDGPALKASHIGIAMGERGTETAKQAASLILVNDDLSNMLTAVEFGRKIYANLKKAVRYIISIHIPLISVVTIPILFGMKYLNLFSPIHVIFLELVMGPTCSIAFESEPAEKNLLSSKPRKLTAKFFELKELSVSIIQGLVITAGLLYIMNFAAENLLPENQARTLVFTTLVLANILLTLTGRSATYSIFTTIFYKNNLMYMIIFITLIILFLSLTFTPLMNIFEFASIDVNQFIHCFAAAFISVMWIELIKIFRKQKD